MDKILEVKAANESRLNVTIELPDFLGLLSVITGVFAYSGISIIRAKIGTVEGQARDQFEVELKRPVDWSAIEADLKTFTESSRQGKFSEVRDAINQRIIQFLRHLKSEDRSVLSPIQLALDQNSSPRETVIDIQAEDTPAFLYELTNALSLLGINIVRMEVDTVQNRVNDRLWVTDENREKISSEEKLKSLQWAILLVKQFTHLLPKVPDPKAALEQITMFGKDILSRRDFNEVLLTLKKSRTLEDLSKVFGTSRFLWEEFIRTQHESIFPILADEKILKVKKNRALMHKELLRLLHGKKSFEDRVRLLNEYKDREMFRIDLRHILGKVSYLGEFAEEFTDLAEAVVEAACQFIWDEMVERHPPPMISESAASEYLVCSLGKFGGRELGYASDLELMFIYTDDPDSSSERSQKNLRFYSEFVRTFKKVIHARGEGVFEIDLRLRPYGNDGPLAVSMNLFLDYYRSGGGAWNFERQALIKLRPVAGPEKLSTEIDKRKDEFVFGTRPYDFEDALKLRGRQRTELVAKGTLNAKYSAGGLLDAEYLVQALQLAYGQKFSGDVRHPNTLKALHALWEAGAVPEKEYYALRAAYIFLRSLINALRIVRGNAKDLTIPKSEMEEYTILARRIGFTGEDEAVRKKFQKMNERYMGISRVLYQTTMERLAKSAWNEIPQRLSVTSRIPRVNLDDLFRCEISSVEHRVLSELGFEDVPELMRRLSQICPNMLTFEPFTLALERAWSLWPDIPNPDLAIQHLQFFTEALTEKEPFWEQLADSENSLAILLKLFGTSRYLSEILIANPDDWVWMLNEKHLSLEHTQAFLDENRQRKMTTEELRRFRHRETLRIALTEMLTQSPLEAVYRTFTKLADLILEKVLQSCADPRELCVIGLGKLGGEELNFSSDIDLMFLCSDDADRVQLAKSIKDYLNILKEGGINDFLYRVDLRLRPHGDNGSLLLPLAEYEHYYRTDADAWEYQAMIKARPVAGNIPMGNQLMTVLDKVAYRNPLTPEVAARLREIKRLYEKATADKNESESNIKLGTGGIRDIEFTVQMIQMKSFFRVPELKTAHTLRALNVIEKNKLLSEADCAALRAGYILLRSIENRLQLYQNRQVFNLPDSPVEKRRLALSLGFKNKGGEDAAAWFERDLKLIRGRCREIFEHVFFGD